MSSTSKKLTKKLKESQRDKEKAVLTLRAAIFNDKGEDKDVTAGISPAFMMVRRSRSYNII
jgi:hypothetical protein